MPKRFANVGTTETNIVQFPEGKLPVITGIVLTNPESSATVVGFSEDGNPVLMVAVGAGETKYLENLNMDLSPGSKLTAVASAGTVAVTVIYQLK